MSVSKHLINLPENCVKESINGFVYANNTNLFTLNDYPNVVVRRDYASLTESGKVALVTGGGSGHEPSHSGFIGKGMLTAAVCGNVFASPSIASILAAIRLVGTNNEGGVLMIVKNYTGDRLNFGIAASRAKAEGIHVESVLVNDDVALLNENVDINENSVGRRGLCGTVFVHKLAGALAEQNKSLKEIKQILDSILNGNLIRTVGVSLSGGVTIPTNILVKNEAKKDEEIIELGMGIHGEQGRTKLSLGHCYDLVKTVFKYLELNNEKDVLNICLMVNNLGALSNFEFNLLVNDTCKYVLNERANFSIKRLYSGHIMTALDMNGFSITMLIVKDKGWLDLLDFHTNAFSWPKQYGVDLNETLNQNARLLSAANKRFNKEEKSDESKYLKFNNPEHAQLLKLCLRMICLDLIDFKDHLNKLDAGCGDGDCGNSMETLSKLILEKLSDEKYFDFQNPHQVLTKVSQLIEQCGGSLCALLTLSCSAAAQGFLRVKNDDSDELVWLKHWTQALGLAINAIQEYGRTKPNQRSFLDPLFTVHEDLKQICDSKETKASEITAIVKKIVDISYSSAHATAKMVPKVGRASYVDPKSVTTPDAGAIAINSMFTSIYKIFLNPSL